MKNRNFFEVYADEYDILTTAKQREIFHQKEINSLIDNFKPTHVLDAGCATGLTSYLFAKNNVKAVGLDRSKPMIKMAKGKFGHLDLDLSYRYGNFEKLPKSLHNKFDMIVSLANSLSGVGSMLNLIRSLKNFISVLKKDGTLVVQMLNYYSIKDGDFLPIKATRNNNIVYQRFSERRGKRLYVYVNRVDLSCDPLKYEMFRHEFENFDPKEMVSAMRKAGFNQIKQYSDLYLKKKFIKTSRDLVIVAKK